jgi:hypothetical protein
MPLLDHFHPPINQRRSWEGFHGLWAAALVSIGQSLPLLPLALRNSGVVPVDLDETYHEARQRSRLE